MGGDSLSPLSAGAFAARVRFPGREDGRSFDAADASGFGADFGLCSFGASTRWTGALPNVPTGGVFVVVADPLSYGMYLASGLGIG